MTKMDNLTWVVALLQSYLSANLLIETCKAQIQKTHSVIAVCFNNFLAYFFARDEVPKDCQSQQFHSDGLLGCRAFLVCDHALVGVDGILKAAFLQHGDLRLLISGRLPALGRESASFLSFRWFIHWSLTPWLGVQKLSGSG